MALQVSSQTITQPVATGNVSYTGVGFTPQVILTFGNDLTATGTAANSAGAYGAAISSTSRFVISGVGRDNQATSATHFKTGTNRCLMSLGSTGALTADADLVTLDADGYTINWTTASATARMFHIISIGGSDLTNVAISNFTTPTSTGDFAITDTGFTPDCVLLFCAQGTAADTSGTSDTLSIAAFTSSTQWASSGENRDAQAGGSSRRLQKMAKAFSSILNDNTLGEEATLTSMDSGGFTLNFGTVNATGRIVFYVALKGGQYKAGAITQTTTTGNKTYDGIGFKPSGVLFSNMDSASTTSITNSLDMGFGVGVSTGDQRHVNYVGTNAASNTEESQNASTVSCVKCMDRPVSSPLTLRSEASYLTSFGDGFNLNWTTVDSTKREILYLAMGSNATTGNVVNTFSKPLRPKIFAPGIAR